MSKYAEGTIVQHTKVEAVKYHLNPRTERDERPWEAFDVPSLLTKLMGEDNNKFRFTDEDISEAIESGELIVM